MSHQVESMSWTNERPWHNLGVEVASNLTSDQMLKAAKLNWSVEKRLIGFESGQSDGNQNFEIVENQFALVRSSDNSCLDIVGKNYIPVQNKDAFKFFVDFVKAGKMKMDTAGSLRKGRMIWGLASINNSFTLPGKDKVNGYLLLASPHEQGKSLRIKFTATRVVCNNTITIALNEKDLGFRMTHRHHFDDDMIEHAKDVLGIADEHLHNYEKQAKRLTTIKIKDKKKIAKYFAKVFYPDFKDLPDADYQTLTRMKPIALAQLALEHSPGALMDSTHHTAWGMHNACTYVVDHMLGRSQDARLSKAWFGAGARAKLTSLKLALEL